MSKGVEKVIILFLDDLFLFLILAKYHICLIAWSTACCCCCCCCCLKRCYLNDALLSPDVLSHQFCFNAIQSYFLNFSFVEPLQSNH